MSAADTPLVIEEARSRNCQQAILDTHEFQAPGFYEKQGYTCCGVADDWPVGYKQYYFQKRLASHPQPSGVLTTG